MPDSIRQNPTKHARESVIPQRRPQRLLLAAVPHGVDEHHAGQHGGLEDAQQEADGGQRGERVARGHDADQKTPEDEAGADVFPDGEQGHEPEVGQLHGQVAEIEDARKPAVLLAVQVRVGLDAEYCCVAEGVLWALVSLGYSQPGLRVSSSGWMMQLNLLYPGRPTSCSAPPAA